MKIRLMKPIFVMISLLSLCCFAFGGCSEAVLTEEEIFEKHIQTMEAFETEFAYHCLRTFTLEVNGELGDPADRIVTEHWQSGSNSYNEMIIDDAASSGTLYYGGKSYRFSADGSVTEQPYPETEKNKRYDPEAKILFCEAGEDGYTITTATDWRVGDKLGMWVCESTQATYTYDRNWVLKEVQMQAQVVPDPEKASMMEGLETGIWTETYSFYDTEKPEIDEKIEQLWEKAKAAAEAQD